MKIVYVCPARDSTGYGNCGISTVLGLDAAGVDVVPRTIKLCGQDIEPPKRYQELEQKSTSGATHIIQHFLPMWFSYKAGVKNIGYFHCETTNFRPSSWQHYLNMLDEIWVCCPENIDAAKASGVTKPIKLVPVPANTEIYTKKYRPLDINIGNRFAFYHIGDFSARKNIESLIRAYFGEFSRYDNVVLVLKSYMDGKAPQDSLKGITEAINDIKKKMRLRNVDLYPPIIVIPHYLTTEQIYGLHQQCHCFVTMEKGAAWNIPAFDAKGFNKPIIINGCGGQTQFIKQNNFTELLLDYQMEPVYGMSNCPYAGIYTSTEKWANPSIDQCSKYMRQVYTDAQMGRLPKIDNTIWLQEWSLYEKGKLLKEVLEN